MDREKAILHATQFFRFWNYKWVSLSKDQHSSNEYVPNSDDIARSYEKLEQSALEFAKKSKDKIGEAESGRLMVSCIIHNDGPYFEYYISIN